MAPFVAQLELGPRSPASTAAPPRSSSPRSAPTCPSSPPQGTWHRGPGCVRANATRQANAARARPAKGQSGYAEPWSRSASRTKGTYLSERYRQVMRRRGDAKAIVALGHEILLAAYRVLDTAQPYTDPGPTALSKLTAERQRRQAVRRLQDLGFQVAIAPAPTQHDHQSQHDVWLFSEQVPGGPRRHDLDDFVACVIALVLDAGHGGACPVAHFGSFDCFPGQCDALKCDVNLVLQRVTCGAASRPLSGWSQQLLSPSTVSYAPDDAPTSARVLEVGIPVMVEVSKVAIVAIKWTAKPIPGSPAVREEILVGVPATA